MKKIDKDQNFINKFDKKASMPDPVFRYHLKQQVLAEFEKQNFFSRLLNKFTPIQIGALSFASTCLVLFTAFIIVSVYTQKSTLTIGDLGKGISEGEKSVILRNIYSVNPINQISPETALNSNGYQTVDARNSIENLNSNSANTQLTLFQYQTLKQTYNYGDKAQLCDALTNLPHPSKTESYMAANNLTNQYYIKNTSYDENGQLIRAYQADDEKRIEYMGGEYAIRTTVSAPLPNVTTDNTLKSINATITEQYINGKKYYVVSNNEDVSFCTGLSTDAPTMKIINQILVDSETYKVTNSKYYIDSISDSNLILDIKSEYTDGFAVWEMLKDNFIQIPVQIREDSMTITPKYPFGIVIPKSADYLITNTTYTNNAGLASHYFDRAFYPAGSAGDKLMYAQLVNSNTSISAAYGVVVRDSNTHTSLKMTVQTPASNNSTSEGVNTPQSITIDIDGQKVAAKYYDYDENVLEFVYKDCKYVLTYTDDLYTIPQFTYIAL